MLHANLRGAVLFLALLVPIYAQPSAAWHDPSPHRVRFVEVEKDVRLEVLDWGGAGRPLVLLAGGGNTAHVFDEFAPKLTPFCHVYGITRRGFGQSGFAGPVNGVEQLGKDVLAAVAALQLSRPVLAGHSIAGAEMSWIANSHPERVAGLVYLEAAYPYAYSGDNGPTMKEYLEAGGPQPPAPGESDLAGFAALQKWDEQTYGFRTPESEFRQTWTATPEGRPGKARDFPGAQAFMTIMADPRRFTAIPVPVLAIFAMPHVPDRWMHDEGKAYYATIDALTEKQANALETGVQGARVVRLRGAHYIFLSNKAEVLRQMRSFLAGLK